MGAQQQKAEPRADGEVEVVAGDAPEKQKAVGGAGPIRKKIQDALLLKSFEEVYKETQGQMQALTARIEEAASLEDAQDALAKDSEHAFTAAKAEVEKAIEAEA